MIPQSPATIAGVREQIAPEAVPGHVDIRQELVPAPAVPVGRMIATAVGSTAAFVVLSLTPYVNDSVTTVQNSFGLHLLANELFWLSAAAMGASFAMLLQASGFRRMEDDGRRYALQFFVALMAAFILVTLIPVGGLLASTGLSQPNLALLGAFFASMVFRFLPGGRMPPANGGDNATQEP
jgi:hypothetical protein